RQDQGGHAAERDAQCRTQGGPGLKVKAPVRPAGRVKRLAESAGCFCLALPPSSLLPVGEGHRRPTAFCSIIADTFFSPFPEGRIF
ncbi:MAG TPA: hypothetical protein VFH22_05265, partial [Rhodocyclaceae bacterium]|nr:hypothetical protein [Rhodocyclaceae bacterium]